MYVLCTLFFRPCSLSLNCTSSDRDSRRLLHLWNDFLWKDVLQRDEALVLAWVLSEFGFMCTSVIYSLQEILRHDCIIFKINEDEQCKSIEFYTNDEQWVFDCQLQRDCAYIIPNETSRVLGKFIKTTWTEQNDWSMLQFLLFYFSSETIRCAK